MERAERRPNAQDQIRAGTRAPSRHVFGNERRGRERDDARIAPNR